MPLKKCPYIILPGNKKWHPIRDVFYSNFNDHLQFFNVLFYVRIEKKRANFLNTFLR